MKVIQIKKQHLKRIIVLIIFGSFFLSYHLHQNEKTHKSKHKEKKPKHEKQKYEKKYAEKINNIEFEEVDLTQVKPDSDDYDAPAEEAADYQQPDYTEESENDDQQNDYNDANESDSESDYAEQEHESEEKEALHKINEDKLPYLVSDLAQSANMDPSLERLRLEDIDISTAEGYPRLGDNAGNYESNPPMPQIGDDGHTGVGEGGKTPVRLTHEEEIKVREALSMWGFNMVASNKVSLDRIPADLRMDECKRWDYPPQLPAVSVVLVFHNEGFTTLMRTVHSVINYSPPELIHEVVLIDDGSTRDYITSGTIDEYISRFNGIVKIFHNDKREGLIRARTIGAKRATGSVLVYLDAHCEVERNWLPPLITPILQDYRVCTVPMVDSIDGNTYVFEPQQGGDENNLARGAWDWNFDWKRIPLNAREKARRKTVSEPYRSPAMAGGLFAISAAWFKELGYYDDKLEIWGGENFEISYKLWQCGGQLLFVPCSRVGHIYRMPGWSGNGTPDELKGQNFIARNYNRVIETWWDSYKQYYYARRPENKNVDTGDLTEVLAIRERLQCKSFEWYMKEIAYDIPKYWPLTQPKMVATGRLRNIGTNTCARQRGMLSNGDPVGMADCATAGKFTLTWHEDIQPGDGTKTPNHCWDTEMEINGHKSLAYWECHHGYGNQLFKYIKDTKQIWNPGHHMCVMAKTDGYLYFTHCNDDDANQQWEWEEIDEEVLARVNNNMDMAGDLPPELDYIQ